MIITKHPLTGKTKLNPFLPSRKMSYMVWAWDESWHFHPALHQMSSCSGSADAWNTGTNLRLELEQDKPQVCLQASQGLWTALSFFKKRALNSVRARRERCWINRSRLISVTEHLKACSWFNCFVFNKQYTLHPAHKNHYTHIFTMKSIQWNTFNSDLLKSPFIMSVLCISVDKSIQFLRNDCAR